MYTSNSINIEACTYDSWYHSGVLLLLLLSLSSVAYTHATIHTRCYIHTQLVNKVGQRYLSSCLCIMWGQLSLLLSRMMTTLYTLNQLRACLCMHPSTSSSSISSSTTGFRLDLSKIQKDEEERENEMMPICMHRWQRLSLSLPSSQQFRVSSFLAQTLRPFFSLQLVPCCVTDQNEIKCPENSTCTCFYHVRKTVRIPVIFSILIFSFYARSLIPRWFQ